MYNEKRIIIVLSAALFVSVAINVGLLAQRTYPGFMSNGIGAPGTFAPVPLPTSPDGKLHSLSGTVASVNGNSFVIKATLPGTAKQTDVTVTPATNASITLQIQKDPSTFQQEMLAFQEKQTAAMDSTDATAAPVTPPMPYTSKTIAFSDITAGMSVSITPVEDTKENATKVTAQTIMAMEMPKIPATPQPAAAAPAGGPAANAATPPAPVASPAGDGTGAARPPQPVIPPPTPAQ